MNTIAAALLLLALSSCVNAGTSQPLTCSLDGADIEADPALQELEYDLGEGKQKMMVYVQPDVTSFYKDETAPSKTQVTPKHNGLAGLFINMSNQHLRLYWEPYKGGAASLIERFAPFSTGGTATFPGHLFYFTPEEDQSNILYRFTVSEYPNNVYRYDPYLVEGDPKQTEKNLQDELDSEELKVYQKMDRTRRFGEIYKEKTGRSYLVNYPRNPPRHFLWRADYFGQTHWVTTKETHFNVLPPKIRLPRITAQGKARILPDDKPRLLQEYRTQDQTVMNMTLKAISCAPRAFEVPNFLSQVEVDHILELAGAEKLKTSSTGSGDIEEDNRRTRTSRNSWIERERSPIVDAVYRRAADLMRIPESMLRQRGKGERDDMHSDQTIAETLQLVHYDVGQEYTAHHDFGFSDPDDELQGQRFATLLLYLNEGMIGGSTSFPRWANAETFEELRVFPEVGKAILFYSQLPDGNMDDLSHHQANKLHKGEKWLINLWVWDPDYDRSPF